ncbi:MAG: DUF3883 domain-containing protein [Planctomycetota bacterium]
MMIRLSEEELREKQSHFEIIRQRNYKHYKDLEFLRRRFVRKFTIDYIRRMRKEDYVEGKIINNKTDKNTFCYWVEWELRDLGHMQGARADKFGLYVKRQVQEYRFIKRFRDANNAIEFLRNEIIKLIVLGADKNLTEIDNIQLSPMFKGKILFLYHPNYFANIFSGSHIDYFLKQLGIYYATQRLNLIQKRNELLTWKNNDSVMKRWGMFEFSDFLYNEFGRPDKQVPNELKENFPSDDYPDPKKVQAEFIRLEINPYMENKATTSRKKVTKPIDFERENKKNKILGNHGEMIVFLKEKESLEKDNRKDLADRVRLIAQENVSAGYDILSYELNGDPKYIEVKSTNMDYSNSIQFIISAYELKVAQNLDNYYLYIVFKTKSINPKIWKVKDLFRYRTKEISLTPINYRVQINIR